MIVLEPDERTMEFAVDLAQGHALAVLDAVQGSWREWAVACNARSATGALLPTALAPDQHEKMLRVLRMGAASGWSSRAFTRGAFSLLGPRWGHSLTVPTLVAACLAFGLEARPAERLRSRLTARTWADQTASC